MSHNITDAGGTWFVNPSAGDLHLSSPIAIVVDQGRVIPGLTGDFDGDGRLQGERIDTGTDEYLAASSHITPAADNPNPLTSPLKLVFVHHSTGGDWLADIGTHDYAGGLGRELMRNNYFVSATNYGWEVSGDAIGDRTDIGHWWEWFRGPNRDAIMDTLYNENGQNFGDFGSWPRPSEDPGGENEIIMFKSCFPNAHLGGNPDDPPTTGDNPLRGRDTWSGDNVHNVANVKGIYNDILEYFAIRQDKLFIVITAPPLQKDDIYQPTDAAHAANARAFNDWLVHDWLAGYPYNNVAVFDFYNVLTSNGGDPNTNDLGEESGNHHRWRNGAVQHAHTESDNFAAYASASDSHPTAAGGQKATAEFVPLLNVFYNRWKEGAATSTSTATGTPPLGQHTIVFQQGVSPDPSYSGTADVILANDAEPNANLGGADHLETFFGEGQEHRRSLIRWDLSTLPANVIVNSASLELYRYDGSAENAMTLTLHRLTRDWTEGSGSDFWPPMEYVPDGATWTTTDGNTPWTNPGGDYEATVVDQITLPAGMENGWIHLDATVVVRAWIEEGVPNHGLLLRPLGGDYTYHYFYSRDASPVELHPRLVITYTVQDTSISIDEPPLPPAPSQLIQPSDPVYLGAFRLPDGPQEIGWEWGGSAMTYYPDGDPEGSDDGYPGSILGTGHDRTQYVSEISIPVPVVSPDKDVNDLNTAETLQDFHDIRGNLYDGRFYALEIPRAGLAYLPKQGSQRTDKLHFCWGIHMQEGDTGPSHGWCELDLSDPKSAGIWRIGAYWSYATTDYLFDIPPSWADTYTPGQYLATGRFRDGGQGGKGPSLIAYGLWNEGNPPEPGSTLSATPLLLYGTAYEENPPAMNNYHHSDEWSGGAWLTAGDKSAVIFVGTKGTGDCWYGCADGRVWEPPYLSECPERGWWSTGFVGQILFYDPAELAAVAQGEMETWKPQPYATLDIDQYLYHIKSSQQKHHVGAASFDRERGLLYIFEPLADGDKPLVHVWRIEG